MKRRLIMSLLTVLACASLGSADLVIERPYAEAEKVAALGLRSYSQAFIAHKRAVAIASGDGQSCLGLYVFDAHGNCVVHDDVTTAQTADDLGVDWIPIETSAYDVQVRNAGFEGNTYNIALR